MHRKGDAEGEIYFRAPNEAKPPDGINGVAIDFVNDNYEFRLIPGEQFDDASVDADVRLASGSPNSHFGVMCRHADLDNFYYFAISADGYYAIFRRVDGGDMEILTGDGGQMPHSAVIKTGEEDNHLSAVCQGDELSLYVNAQLLETVTDDTHARGDVGLGAGSGAEGEVRIQFDDLVVTRP